MKSQSCLTGWWHEADLAHKQQFSDAALHGGELLAAVRQPRTGALA